MPHPLTSDLSLGYFNPAVFTDNAFMANTLVLTTVTFPVFLRSKNFLAKQPLFFWFQGSIINGFRFFYFST